jgi:uncharacterized protein (TIGR00251 family)
MAQKRGVRIEVRVHPQAKRSRVSGMLGSAYKLDVSAPATDGRANDACVELLGEVAGIGRRQIRLIKGLTSRSKIFEFEGIEELELRRRLDQAT